MLVTLALILIMMVMLYGFGSRSHQQRQKKVCQKNLQKSYVALQIFAGEHQNAFPVLAGATTAEAPLTVLVPGYTVDTSSFICPGSKDKPLKAGISFGDARISYAYFMGQRSEDTSSSDNPTNAGPQFLMSDRQVNAERKEIGEQVFSKDGKRPGNNHHQYGGNYLFIDGHMEMTGPLAKFPIIWPAGVQLLNPKP